MLKDGISIIIPIKCFNEKNIPSFISYISYLNKEFQTRKVKYQIIIADESNSSFYEIIDKGIVHDPQITHFAPTGAELSGRNDKMNGIYASLKYLLYIYTFIIDDHYRITVNEFIEATSAFSDYELFKLVPRFNRYPISICIDMAGLFFRSVINKDGQFSGHIAIRSELLLQGFPNRNGLYDEYVIENYYKHRGVRTGFPKGIYFTAEQNISLKKFCEQRIRYSYENIAFPFRFITHLLLLPLYIYFFSIGACIFVPACIAYVFLLLIISCIGQIKYASKDMPKTIFLYSVIWHLSYWFTSWIALFLFLTVGVRFGNKHIHSPK